MASYDAGKPEIVNWIREHFPRGSSCLDVGACDGKWSDLLRDYLIMDGIEAFEPNITGHNLAAKYRKIICKDVASYRYFWYDLVIFGDVIEHMDVPKAQKVLRYAKRHCTDMIIGVPWCLKQPAIYGNPWEVHIQDDLTEELFHQRYKGFDRIIQPLPDYAYFHKAEK